MSKKLIISGYRCLLRYAHELSLKSLPCLIMPLDNHHNKDYDNHWGKHQWYDSEQSYLMTLYKKLFPSLNHQIYVQLMDKEFNLILLKTVIKNAFKQQHSLTPNATQEILHAIRVVGEQRKLQKLSSYTTFDGIHVYITPFYIKEQKDTDGNRVYTFSYKVKINYSGFDTVQIFARYWELQENDGRWQELIPKKSLGLVGQYPKFIGGESKIFEYVSGCYTHYPKSKMKGTFYFAKISSKDKEDAKESLHEFSIEPIKLEK